jgi:hypothetical protein
MCVVVSEPVPEGLHQLKGTGPFLQPEALVFDGPHEVLCVCVALRNVVTGECRLTPQYAETVRARNWVERGDVVPHRPGRYPPHAARLYRRPSRLSAGETLRTNTALTVALVRPAEAELAVPVLDVCEGA